MALRLVSYQPKTRLAVCYKTEPTLYCERVLLSHLQGEIYILLTPDREIIEENLSTVGESASLSVRRMRADGTALGAKDSECYTFDISEEGPLSESDIGDWISQAEYLYGLTRKEPEPPVEDVSNNLLADAIARAERGGNSHTLPAAVTSSNEPLASGNLIAQALAKAAREGTPSDPKVSWFLPNQ